MIPYAFFYGNAFLSGLPFDPPLDAYSRFVVTREAAAGLATRDAEAWAKLLPRTWLYHNAWGCAYPSLKSVGGFAWQHGPQDLHPGLPLIRSPKGPYPYCLDSDHEQAWFENCHGIMRSTEWGACAGLFADDWTTHVRHWNLTPEQQAIVWPNGSNRAMWPLEKKLRTLATLAHKGPQGILVNGPAVNGPRCFEDVGKWITRAEVERDAQAGDCILVYGVNRAGTGWGKTTVPMGWQVGTSFRTVFRWARDLAEALNLGLALGYQDAPTNGYHSKCSPHKFTPETWGSL